LDGLELPSQFHAFFEGCLTGLFNFVSEGILNTNQKELVFEKQGHIVNSFHLGLGDSGTGKSNCGHVGPVVNQVVVGNMDAAAIVIHALIGVLFYVGKVSADGLGRVLGLKGVQELLLDVVPDDEVDSTIPEQFPPNYCTLPEAHFELLDFARFIPCGSFSGVLDVVD
jgi:hypothetical protein